MRDGRPHPNATLMREPADSGRQSELTVVRVRLGVGGLDVDRPGMIGPGLIPEVKRNLYPGGSGARGQEREEREGPPGSGQPRQPVRAVAHHH